MAIGLIEIRGANGRANFGFGVWVRRLLSIWLQGLNLMEMSSSALAGVLRIGVQVIVSRQRPVLEIYQNLHNAFGPPFEYDIPGSNGKPIKRESYRHQDIFIGLTLINVGGLRAENITFEVSGEFKRSEHFRLPGMLQSKLRQMAPGQAIYLMRIDQHDLHEYVSEPDNPSVQKQGRLKTDILTIKAHYDGPNTFINRMLRAPRRWRGIKQYETEFIFDPQNVAGDLPPATYQG